MSAPRRQRRRDLGRGRERRRYSTVAPSPAIENGYLPEDGWIEYCDGSMFVVGYTEGGAPYGYVDWTGTRSFPDDNSGSSDSGSTTGVS